MADKTIEDAVKALLGEIDALLKPRGFRKQGHRFRRQSGGNAGLIELQRSQSSSRERVRFTFNVGVICGRLLDEYEPPASKAGVIHAHLRMRIGEFLTAPMDKWWDLTADASLADLIAELAPLLDLAAGYLADHLDDAQLIALWRSGRSPGVTDGRRQDYLRELTAA